MGAGVLLCLQEQLEGGDKLMQGEVACLVGVADELGEGTVNGALLRCAAGTRRAGACGSVPSLKSVAGFLGGEVAVTVANLLGSRAEARTAFVRRAVGLLCRTAALPRYSAGRPVHDFSSTSGLQLDWEILPFTVIRLRAQARSFSPPGA